MIYFRKNPRKISLENLATSKQFKIVKQPKKIIFGFQNLYLNPYEYVLYDEENPDFYKQNKISSDKYINLQERLNYNYVNIFIFFKKNIGDLIQERRKRKRK